MRYVDVILPLPLDGTFTYSIPEGMEEKVVAGMRVLVPLGKSKKYIAMVADVHSEKPDFNCKPIEAVLDSYPSLLPQQYRLWHGSAITICLLLAMYIMQLCLPE